MNSSVRVGRLLHELKPVFKRWIALHEKYAKYWEGEDCGWWHNERASTSILAVAGWRPGEVALEEYAAKQGRTGDAYTGRCDLYLTNRKHDFVVEAKQVWVNLVHARKGIDEIKAALNEACKDAAYSHDPVSRRIGLVFIVPSMRSPDKRDRKRLLTVWHQELDKIQSDALCWVAPKETEKLRADGQFFPEVELIARVVKKHR